MHPYTIDSNARTKVFIILVGLSILTAWAFSRALALPGWSVPWWIDAPSVMGFFGFYTQLFERVLWRHPLLRRLGLIEVPDLNGSWRGPVTSSFGDEHYGHDVTITIVQRWSRIAIRLDGAHSQSRSLTAALLGEESVTSELSYEYLNEPHAGATDAMQAHRGTARLALQRTAQGDALVGEYYTGRGRTTHGRLCVERVRDA